MRVLNERAVGELCADARAFGEGLAATSWADAAKADQLLVGHKLNPAGLAARLRPTIEGS